MSLLFQVGYCEGSRIVRLAMTTRCIAVGTGNEARSCGHVVAPLSVVVYSRRRLYLYFHQPLNLCFILEYNEFNKFILFSKAYRLWKFTIFVNYFSIMKFALH